MEALSPFQLAFHILVLTGAFAVRGGTGFGAAIIAIPMLALIMPLTIAVPVVAVLNVLNSIGKVRRDWCKIAWPDLLTLLPYTLVGIMVGIYMMSSIDETALVHAFGAFLIFVVLTVFEIPQRNRVITCPAYFNARLVYSPRGADETCRLSGKPDVRPEVA